MNVQNLAVNISRQGSRFVAYAPAFDIATSGKTEKQAKERFVEMIAIFIDELVQAGTLKEVLTELGWKKAQKQWTPPEVRQKNIKLNIPALAVA